ncbi:GNAT family N-acetyltransferase [Deefgea tanakiae]|uniref:GNAT family N-acetyltransferase n=1 Tax=Deefgea tanakiae TaxID=2865840 RepID=A0ABX8Z6G6_9NEIS|nr:GNAT family protein [Deefgea tanakiae]QZA76628.1 GNAT family N-acetyltransferase [Deefgea tanakiae]
MGIHIETARLILKSITEADRGFFSQLHQHPDVMRYVSDTLSADTINEKFNSRLTAWTKHSSHWLCLIMIDKRRNMPIGVTGFIPEWEPYQQAEVGFLLHPDEQGKGYGKESLQAVLKFAFNDCLFHKIKATVTEGNIASASLLEQAGFIQEGKIRDNSKLNMQWHNDLIYGLLNSEFSPILTKN